MTKVKKNPEREQHIDMDIVVDAYDEVERSLGWYYRVIDFEKMDMVKGNKCVKIDFQGSVNSLQPRIWLLRSFDQRTHNYLVYALPVYLNR